MSVQKAPQTHDHPAVDYLWSGLPAGSPRAPLPAFLGSCTLTKQPAFWPTWGVLPSNGHHNLPSFAASAHPSAGTILTISCQNCHNVHCMFVAHISIPLSCKMCAAEFSWSVTYDAICCALEHRADCMALSVRTSPSFQGMNRQDANLKPGLLCVGGC